MSDLPARSRIRIRLDQETPADPAGHTRPDDTGGTPPNGYGKPPREHRFKSGHSGNPKGRPKGSKNFATIVAELLSRPVRVKVGGVAQDKKILPAEAVVSIVVAKAMKGDRHAIDTFFRWAQEYDAARERRDAVLFLDEKEAAILRRMQENFRQAGDAS